MNKKSILVVEGEVSIAESIKARLEQHDEFDVELVSTGYGALRSMAVSIPDALLLDATLPDLSGFEVCGVIRSRERTVHLPVIMLGEQQGAVGLVNGLERGADDYVVKPFDPKELEARLKAVLRRRRHTRRQAGPDRFIGVHLHADFLEVCILVDGDPVSLTKREFLLLQSLVQNCNHILNRQTLLSDVWGSNEWNERTVDSAIWKLRAKLRQAGHQIETIVNFGYRFNEPPNERKEQP